MYCGRLPDASAIDEKLRRSHITCDMRRKLICGDDILYIVLVYLHQVSQYIMSVVVTIEQVEVDGVTFTMEELPPKTVKPCCKTCGLAILFTALQKERMQCSVCREREMRLINGKKRREENKKFLEAYRKRPEVIKMAEMNEKMERLIARDKKRFREMKKDMVKAEMLKKKLSA